jgi:hypothetical protein
MTGNQLRALWGAQTGAQGEQFAPTGQRLKRNFVALLRTCGQVAGSAAPDYLSTQVLAWGKAHTTDPRVPGALALAVKSTRFGCADLKSGELSKAAFDLLHSRYPKSSWPEQTKYWFKM